MRISYSCWVLFCALSFIPLTGMCTDIPLEAARDRVLGEWQVGYRPEMYEPGTRKPLREYFLTGEVGPVWKFEADGSATAYVPCDINKQFKKGVVAVGNWKLLDEGKTLRVDAQMTIASMDPLELQGPLAFGKNALGEAAVTTMTIGNRWFGRYDSRAFTCD